MPSAGFGLKRLKFHTFRQVRIIIKDTVCSTETCQHAMPEGPLIGVKGRSGYVRMGFKDKEDLKESVNRRVRL